MGSEKSGRRTTGRIFKAPGGAWWIDCTHNGKRIRHTLGTANKAEARAKAAPLLSALHLENERDRRAAVGAAVQTTEADLAVAVEAVRPRLALADAWAAYEADASRPRSGERTLTDYGCIWRAFARWIAENRPGAVSIEDVTPEVAESYMASVEAAGLTGRRFNAIRQALSLAMRVLTRRHAPAEVDPFKRIPRRAVETVGHRPLTVEELRAVFEAAQGEMKTLLALGMFAGFRLADACLLRWPEVDMVSGKITRVPSKVRSRTARAVVVPMHPVLRDLIGRTPPSRRRGYVLPETAERYRQDWAGVSKDVRLLFESVGIQTREEREGGKRAAAVASFHSLRHSLITALARQGTPLHEVRALVGHGSEAVQSLYLHAAESDVRRAVEALPSPVMALPPPADSLDALRAEVIRLARTAGESDLRQALAALKNLRRRLDNRERRATVELHCMMPKAAKTRSSRPKK